MTRYYVFFTLSLLALLGAVASMIFLTKHVVLIWSLFGTALLLVIGGLLPFRR